VDEKTSKIPSNIEKRIHISRKYTVCHVCVLPDDTG